MKLTKIKLNSRDRTIPIAKPLTGFRTTHTLPAGTGHARRGVLQVNGIHLETPALFPVINLLTGPPSLHRNGATHKFLKRQLIFRNLRPGFMTEVLHFTDYPFRPKSFRDWFPHAAGSAEVKTLSYWVQKSFQELDLADQAYQPLFFLDSGGFRLLFNREVDISEFGYQATQESILQLQLDYGADIVASLDFPVPPFLNTVQATERIGKSVQNAVTLMDLLYRQDKTDPTGKKPFPILAIHGQTPEQIRSCILHLLWSLDAAGFANEPFGLGIGSLVPLRISSGADKIVMIVRSAISTLHSKDVPPSIDPATIPVHAFGITGDMIPVLTHLGVDTYDSSSYVKSASVLDYYDPATWSPLDFRALKGLTCDCDACKGVTPDQLARMQEILRGPKIQGNAERLGALAGVHIIDIKSDVYGLIAYHNLNLQDREIARVSDSIDANETAQHLVKFSQVHSRAQALVEFIADIDPLVAKALGHVQINLIPRSTEEIEQHYNTISLTNDPAAFDLACNPDYVVPEGKDRLLLLACSQAKPYRTSKSHSAVNRFLRQQLGETLDSCHKVTVSGLYGPVPLEYEDTEAVRIYEYVLSSTAKHQRELIVARLVAYLMAHLGSYQRVVAYVTATAYRRVVETAFERVRAQIAECNAASPLLQVPLLIMPLKSHGTGTKDLLTHAHLRELLAALYPEHDRPVDTQTQLPLAKIHSLPQEP